MTRHFPRSRAGITLTEILISILIMGVGLISLATLFPLGLLRLRASARDVRSVMLNETATNDASARNLLVKSSFSSTWYGGFDPMTVDPADPTTLTDTTGLNYIAIPGPGVPFCYDPLWRALAGVKPNATGTAEGRFASGVGIVRADPDGKAASAYGLQRLTNMPVLDQWGWNTLDTTKPAGVIQQAAWLDMVGKIFASQDDIVLQQSAANVNIAQGKGNPLAADLSSGTVSNDWSYTWMFTGQQSDVFNGSMFDGDMVIFHNRPFGLDTTTGFAQGERVVEAIFGYGSNVSMVVVDSTSGAASTITSSGYATNMSTVLLRWPSGQPDPDVKIGSWIADVTYERYAAIDLSRFQSSQVASPNVQVERYSGQRCHWYRVAKKTQIEAEDVNSSPPVNAGYRRMVVTIETPVRSKTLLSKGGSPVHVNVALTSPYVVNVFPWVFHAR